MKLPSKLVSILIPAYNCEKWLPLALESALSQTWSDVEVIVVDDGSTDQTREVAKRYESDRVRVITQVNAGASAARNRAFDESRGGFIQYLDGDDLLAPDKIERQMPSLLEDPTLLCSGEWGAFYFDKDRAVFVENQLCQDHSPTGWLIAAWGNGLMMQPGAWLAARQTIERAGRWNESLSLDDDGEFFTRVVLAASRVKFVPGARVYYRFGYTGSLSWSRSRKAYESHYQATTLSIEHLLKVDRSPEARQAAAERLMYFVYNTYPQAPDLVAAAEQMLRRLETPQPLPRGGPVFRIMTRLIGWKMAKTFRQPYYMTKLSLSRWLERLSKVV